MSDEAAVEDRLDALLLRWWDSDPTQPALISGDTQITTGDLRDRVLRVAQVLSDRGVRPGDRVVVHLERSIDFVVAVLGSVIAGAAYAALDVNDPPERTLQLIHDCGPKVLITNLARLRPLQRGIADLDTVIEGHLTGTAPTGWRPRVTPSASDPVVIIYTSGSTGAPKGALISHRALTSRIAALQQSNRIGVGDRIIHHTACSFDMYLLEVYWPLVAGATVVIAAPGRHRDADHLAELIERHRISTFHCVVSLLELFLLARPDNERYDGIRQVLTGGEPLSPELVKRLHTRTNASLTNLYGPSECTLYCTSWVCSREPDLDRVLIGYPPPETELLILDPDGNPVPDGTPGELYIGGAGLANGYLNRPELTAERFIEGHPAAPQTRLYRSGDLVTRLDNGALEFHGRLDRQVKIRGIRVELGEIEAVATRHPGVRQAAAVAHGTGGRKELAPFIVPAGNGHWPGLENAVRQSLRTVLPSYMVPQRIEPLVTLPLTRNGKLDGSRLEELADGCRTSPTEPQPTTPAAATRGVEEILTPIWTDALGVATVDPDADFFDAGGDSFKAVLVVQHSENALSVDIPILTLLHEPTLAAFSKAVQRIADSKAAR